MRVQEADEEAERKTGGEKAQSVAFKYVAAPGTGDGTDGWIERESMAVDGLGEATNKMMTDCSRVTVMAQAVLAERIVESGDLRSPPAQPCQDFPSWGFTYRI